MKGSTLLIRSFQKFLMAYKDSEDFNQNILNTQYIISAKLQVYSVYGAKLRKSSSYKEKWQLISLSTHPQFIMSIPRETICSSPVNCKFENEKTNLLPDNWTIIYVADGPTRSLH